MPNKPMTDEEIRLQLKKAGGLLAELNTMVNDLTSQLDERARQNAPRPAVAANAEKPAEKPVAEVRPANRYGFLLPKSLSGSFNATRQLVEGQALPNYVHDDVKPQDLADFKSVLGALAARSAQHANRDAIYPVDIEQYLLPGDSPQSEAERRVLDIIEGKSAMGFNVAILSARTEDNKRAYLYLVEDKLREKMIVAGPEKISGALKAELEKGGVSYVVKTDKDCVGAVNEFLAEGALYRGRKGFLLPGKTVAVIDELLKGFSTLCTVADVEPSQNSSLRGRTLGQVIHAEGSPVCYTQITKPRALKA